MTLRRFRQLALIREGAVVGEEAPGDALSVETIHRIVGVQGRLY
jgi:hypothetical protein